MRVLWFSVTPSMFTPRGIMHNAGGWISSLESIVRKCENIELGVAFHYNDNGFKYTNDDVTYYPINLPKQSIIRRLLGGKTKAPLDFYLQIINDFQPDVIQIFGSENDFGLICNHTSIPVVIHIQGCMPPYHNAAYPVGMNEYDFFFTRGLSLNRRRIGLRTKPGFEKIAEREIRIIQSCKYFMGRTEWDKSLIELFNPHATYFHCEEALRDSFINSTQFWSWKDNSIVRIVSIISNPWYKGIDLILKTAKLLKRFTNLNFQWEVYGTRDIRFYENKYNIKANEVNVKIMGVASKEQLTEALLNASCYVHPSYIDNSPNSICEAQYIGVPVIACNVGGVSSILKNGKAGILIPANAPYTLADRIKKLTNDRELSEALSLSEKSFSHNRHDPEKLKDTLLSIYETITSTR